MPSDKTNRLLKIALLLSFPIVLLCTMPLLPTHDDWTSSPAPDADTFSWSLLLPRLGYWRIPEVLYGWLCGHCRWLFPGLGHVITVSGHYVGALMVWRLCTLLRYSSLSRGIATVFFLVSTGMIATLTACDGMSQTWTTVLGLIALYSFIKSQQNIENQQNANRASKEFSIFNFQLSISNFQFSIFILFAACFIKENAIIWFFIVPFVALMLRQCTIAAVKRFIVPAALLAGVYLALRFLLPAAGDVQINEDYADIFSPAMIARGTALTVAYTLLPIDYAAILQAEHRNIVIAAITFLTSLPFLWVLLLRSIRSKANRAALTFALAIFLTVGIHLITVFSLMHIYSCMGMAALLVATLVNSDRTTRRRTYIVTFALYVATALFTNAHHYMAAYDSGCMGRQLAQQAIAKTMETLGKPADKVHIIYKDTGYAKYSSFYVIPVEAMGWGIAAQWETDYKWPKVITDEYLADDNLIESATQQKFAEGYDCVWIINGQEADVSLSVVRR